MASSLSKLVDNLSEGIHNNKCSDCGSNLDYIKITAKPSSLVLLPFLPERMEISNISLVKLVCNLYNKKKYVAHINTLKQALNHGLKFKKIHRVIEFNQEAWLKPYNDMNTELRKLAKNDFEKDLF